MGCNASNEEQKSSKTEMNLGRRKPEKQPEYDSKEEINPKNFMKHQLKKLSKLKNPQSIQNFEIKLNGKNPEHRVFFKLVHKYKIPVYGRLVIENCDMFDEQTLNKFLVAKEGVHASKNDKTSPESI